MHDYDFDVEHLSRSGSCFVRCYCCGGELKNTYSPSGKLLRKNYPYAATYRIIKGRDKGKHTFEIICRECAYEYGVGVIEMDGEPYFEPDEFNEQKYKEEE